MYYVLEHCRGYVYMSDTINQLYKLIIFGHTIINDLNKIQVANTFMKFFFSDDNYNKY